MVRDRRPYSSIRRISRNARSVTTWNSSQNFRDKAVQTGVVTNAFGHGVDQSAGDNIREVPVSHERLLRSAGLRRWRTKAWTPCTEVASVQSPLNSSTSTTRRGPQIAEALRRRTCERSGISLCEGGISECLSCVLADAGRIQESGRTKRGRFLCLRSARNLAERGVAVLEQPLQRGHRHHHPPADPDDRDLA